MSTVNPLIVGDTGALISLEKLAHGYWLMQQLYSQLLVPPAVLNELMAGVNKSIADYLIEYQITHFLSVIEPTKIFVYPSEFVLHKGEIQAIALAIEYNCSLLIEEHAGRSVAKHLGIAFSGIAGQILIAYRQKIISAETAKSEWQRLKMAGRIGRNLYKTLLAMI